MDTALFMMNDFGLYYIGDDEHVVVPEVFNSRPVTMIAHEGFANKDIQSIQLPYTLKEIGSSAFRNCHKLQQINIPLSVERIAGGAFQGCHALQEIILHDRIVEIGSYAFDECINLASITLPSQLEYIGAYAFSDTRIKQVTLPEGIEHIANSLFFNCQQLEQVTLPKTTQIIGNCAFAGCVSLSTITFPASLQALREGAFEFCIGLQSVTFTSLLKMADPTAFVDCPNIQTVKAPFTQYTLIEVYDEQRQIFKADAQKLATLPKQELTIAQLFPASTAITWEEIQTTSSIEEIAIQIDYLAQAKVAIEAADFITALKNLDDYSAQYPNESGAYLLKGQIYYVQGDFEQSVIAYREALTTEHTAEVYLHLGHALLDASTQDASIAQYKQNIWHYTAHYPYDDFCLDIAKRALLLSI